MRECQTHTLVQIRPLLLNIVANVQPAACRMRSAATVAADSSDLQSRRTNPSHRRANKIPGQEPVAEQSGQSRERLIADAIAVRVVDALDLVEIEKKG